MISSKILPIHGIIVRMLHLLEGMVNEHVQIVLPKLSKGDESIYLFLAVAGASFT